MMKTIPAGLAQAVLEQQVEIFEDRGISLDSLWRAVGCPAGREPRAWVELADPLIAGYAGYLGHLASGAGHRSGEIPVVWVWDAEDGDPWRAGDLMTVGIIARAYADYLDAGTRPGAVADGPATS